MKRTEPSLAEQVFKEVVAKLERETKGMSADEQIKWFEAERERSRLERAAVREG